MYDLYSLAWHSFQQLCLTITREILGQTVESFLDSFDAGRDGAFSGVWKPVRGESLNGRLVVHCKFTSRHDKNLSLADLYRGPPPTGCNVMVGRSEGNLPFPPRAILNSHELKYFDMPAMTALKDSDVGSCR